MSTETPSPVVRSVEPRFLPFDERGPGRGRLVRVYPGTRDGGDEEKEEEEWCPHSARDRCRVLRSLSCDTGRGPPWLWLSCVSVFPSVLLEINMYLLPSKGSV